MPAVQDGRLIKETLPDHNPSGFQAFFLNTRKAKFSDRRVRRAIGLVFDFEWTNKNLFYGLYQRTYSIFQNSDMEAAGTPKGAELALLEPWWALLGPSPGPWRGLPLGPAISRPLGPGGASPLVIRKQLTPNPIKWS